MVHVDTPDGHATVKVSVIDTGARIRGPLTMFMEPSLLEHHQENLSTPASVFLIEHEQLGRRILFDLGIRKVYEDYPPAVRNYHAAFHVETGAEVFDILQDHGLDLNTIDAIVWR